MVAYFRPATLAEALDICAARPVTILAGGTDIFPARATRAAWGETRHPDVLDITAIAGLDRIERQGDHWRLGALVTWTDLIRAELPPLFAGYKAAAREVGGIQIQNRGTLVGNLVNASPAADGTPCLLTLDASVELTSRAGVRVVPVASFVDGYRHTVIAPDEIATALLVPAQDASGAFLKLGARRYLVISIVMTAGVIATDATGRITLARLAVGSCSAVARRLPELEARLVGRPLGHDLADIVTADDVAALEPIDDVRASGAYRRDAALALLRDLVSNLALSPGRRAA